MSVPMSTNPVAFASVAAHNTVAATKRFTGKREDGEGRFWGSADACFDVAVAVRGIDVDACIGRPGFSFPVFPLPCEPSRIIADPGRQRGRGSRRRRLR